MSESSMPHSAAVVAAPILKLWPAYEEQSYPRTDKAALTLAIKICFVKKRPSLILNRGKWLSSSYRKLSLMLYIYIPVLCQVLVVYRNILCTPTLLVSYSITKLLYIYTLFVSHITIGDKLCTPTQFVP